MDGLLCLWLPRVRASFHPPDSTSLMDEYEELPGLLEQIRTPGAA